MDYGIVLLLGDYMKLKVLINRGLLYFESGDYTNALKSLAALRDPVDRFFDDVMVMADDEATRNNRLALLADLRALFSGVADISRLSLG